jgi:AraC family transcriptional regulator, chitin signaling transcriptional activator
LAAKKKYRDAVRLLLQSLSLAESSGLLALETEIVNQLAKAFEQSHKLEDAISYYNRFISLNERLNSQQKQRELIEIASRVEIEKADRERARMERLANDAETRASLLRQETERQSKELTQLALQIVEKNEFLCDLKEELEPQLKSSKQAKALAQKIDDHIRSDRDWETFENQFNAVHRDFLGRLSAKFPALTPTELKIATMIKLNLPSKAIANLFCLSARTIENHRLSIRKKIGLPGDANLASFFTSFGSSS